MYDTYFLVDSVTYYHSRKFKNMWKEKKGQSCTIILDIILCMILTS